MIPPLGLVLIGRADWTVPLPFPVFLVWPFILVALGGVRLGDPVHLEADCFAKWTHSWLERAGR